MAQQPQNQSSSRLNRLLTLLDTGSTQATRFAAASQIGGIAESHPGELASLLKKVSHYLRSRKWDTRVAAAHAIGAIANKSKLTSLPDLISLVGKRISDAGVSFGGNDIVSCLGLSPTNAPTLSFRNFSLNKVLEYGALLASGGQEYDVAVDSLKSPRERLARQKKSLRRRLGLDVCEQFMDVNEMISDDDLVRGFESPMGGSSNGVRNFRSNRPSARELNLLKRKAKVNSAANAVAVAPKNSAADSSGNNNKVSVDSSFDEENSDNDVEGQWPFHSFVEQLLVDMFDPVWEIRHGSIMALREILTYQGAYVGVQAPNLRLGTAQVSGDNNVSSVTVKREREEGQEQGEDSKRLKVEGDLTETVNIADNPSRSGDLDPIAQVSTEVNPVGYVSINPEVKPDDSKSMSLDMAELVSSNESPDMLTAVSRNPDLLQMVRLTQQSWLQNNEFLLDCAIRFLCVLSLDRFGDYVSDQVVAPVRETCAQALGAVLKFMAPELVSETLNILLQMQYQSEWEIRHGSLLGIKYLVAVRQEMLSSLLGRVLPACKAGLEDPDDDVRAVSADALIPAASSIVALKGQTLYTIVMLLWDILLDLDDLSPSTSSVMNLLSEIYSHESMLDVLTLKDQVLDMNGVPAQENLQGGSMLMDDPYTLSALAPRLWPFMRHSITSVRYSAIRTLERLLEAGYRRYCVTSVHYSSIRTLERLDAGYSGHGAQPSSGSFWPSFILGDTLRIVFQNMLLESNDNILQCTDRVWRLLLHCPIKELETAAQPYVSSWLDLATTPYGSALDTSKMFWPVAPPRKTHDRPATKTRPARFDNEASRSVILDFSRGAVVPAAVVPAAVVPAAVVPGIVAPQENDGHASSSSSKIVVGADLDKSVTHTRVVAATALGVLASKWPMDSLQCIADPLWKNLISLAGVQRQVASMVIISWFQEIRCREFSGTCSAHHILPDQFKKYLLDSLSCVDPSRPTKDSSLPYSELSRTYSKMRAEASQLMYAVESLVKTEKDIVPVSHADTENLGVDDAIEFTSKIVQSDKDRTGKDSVRDRVPDDVDSSKHRLLTTAGYLKCVQNNLHVAVSALMAAAVVWMSDLPVKLNPIILPLMASIKREQEEVLQQKAAEALAELIFQCIARKPSPNEKLIKNLCSCTCMDPLETPQAGVVNSVEMIEEQDLLPLKSTAGTQKRRGRPSAASGGEDRSKMEGFVSRRGAELALKHLCQKFGSDLFDKIPKLWDCLTEVLKPVSEGAEENMISLAIESVKDPQTLINNLQLVRSIVPLLDDSVKPKLLSLLPCIFKCLRHSHVAVRLAASRCISSMAKSMAVTVMGPVVERAVSMLGDRESVPARQGAGMLVSLLVQGLGVELVPYSPILVVPLLRCMSDCDSSVRQSVTRSFAALVPLLPLARGLPPPAGLSDSLVRNKEDVKFLEQLLDNSSIEDYKPSTKLKVTLRRYQQEGVNWLAFLRRFKLHGILCDDMGLGKTLQASAIVASDIAERQTTDSSEELPPSLIVCPSTLVGHWAYEIEKYIDGSLISTLQYVGTTQDRISLRSYFEKHHVIITSYDVVRKDVDYLGELQWNYCILDEGHVIKNARSKVTVAVKQLKAQHRLILSGTPIQNNILDLWSLFDFLMPGFLGSERQFQAAYGKPLLASRDSKCSAKDAEAGILAMEALHKQVMPFLLRRTKSEVLSDLPDKIIQDRYCDLSPAQMKLYEQFSGSQAKEEISSIVELDESSSETKERKGPTKATTHVFRALQYLLKLCSHPLLVVGDQTADTLKSNLTPLFADSSDLLSELHNLHHSPKLVALKEILEECGIGADASNSEGMENVGQHRVLVFAQHLALLDIIEKDLFHTHMKSVTYLRLDGSVHPEKRFDIVKTFNSDPTIDVLLLTTHVGGLGLNLTSADTLVFMEHDWNPMRDLQAMDRAHRLGQKKVVNVHRLIMRGTLEEKVMSLQKFKLSVAGAVINADNASLKTMNTDQLLDLFTSAESCKKGATSSAQTQDGSSQKASGGGKGLKAILNGLEELWDQSQYSDEYNLGQFLAKLNG